MPVAIPKVWCSTEATGARQFVVQLAVDITEWIAGSYLSELTPITIVRSAPLAGALIITLRAPAAMWAEALSFEVKSPVDSMTMSIPMSFQGRAAGSLVERTLNDPARVVIVSPSTFTPPSNLR